MHSLVAAPDTVQWGFYDASVPPVLTVASGDLLHVQTEPPAPREILSVLEPRASAAFRQIVAAGRSGPSSHLLNGPVAVQGARPGDALEISFEHIALRYDWGFNTILPLKGALADEFPVCRPLIVELDRKTGTGSWGSGLRVPLAPFFGNVGVAPAPALGRVPSGLPGPWGGNLDNKELVSGTRLFLPVFNDGALLSIGDGHACQGDGEVDSFALETGLDARLRLTLHPGRHLDRPRAETPTHYIFMGLDPILDDAAKDALRQTLRFLVDEQGLGREDAYALCSLAVDLRVTQIVNGTKGVHAMLARSLLR